MQGACPGYGPTTKTFTPKRTPVLLPSILFRAKAFHIIWILRTARSPRPYPC